MSRIVITGASDGFHARLRARHGLGPAQPYDRAPDGLAYCGRDFRAYPGMRIAEAIRFYASFHDRWNDARLTAQLATAGLDGRFEVRRMKRAYQRALVLALGMAAEPTALVIENAEEFDEDGAFALLQESVELVSRAIVTYGDGAAVMPLRGLNAAIDATAYEEGGAGAYEANDVAAYEANGAGAHEASQTVACVANGPATGETSGP